MITWPRSKVLGQRILCASTKQSSMLRTRGTSGAVHSLEVRKGPIRKAGEVQSADNVEESLLDSVRLAEMDSVGLVHVALPRADALGSSLGQRSAEGKGDPGAVSPENSERWAAHGSVRVRKRLAKVGWIYSGQVLDDSSARPRSRILTAGGVPSESRSSQSQVPL